MITQEIAIPCIFVEVFNSVLDSTFVSFFHLGSKPAPPSLALGQAHPGTLLFRALAFAPRYPIMQMHAVTVQELISFNEAHLRLFQRLFLTRHPSATVLHLCLLSLEHCSVAGGEDSGSLALPRDLPLPDNTVFTNMLYPLLGRSVRTYDFATRILC
jgi:hypothetical protein